jgi:hypothetical protein
LALAEQTRDATITKQLTQLADDTINAKRTSITKAIGE